MFIDKVECFQLALEKVGLDVYLSIQKNLSQKEVLMAVMVVMVEMYTLEVDANTDTLSYYRGKRHLKAKTGQPGPR